MDVKTKVCTKCGEENILSLFTKDRSKSDGYRSYCKKCRNKYLREWCKKNPEKVSQSNMKYNEKNPEKRKATSLNYYKNNTKKILSKNKEWRNRNQHKKKEYNSRDIALLNNRYIKTVIYNTYGIKAIEVDNEFIEVKRRQLQYYRKLKHLKNERNQRV